MKIEEFGNTIKIIADEGKELCNFFNTQIRGKEFILSVMDKVENYFEKSLNGDWHIEDRKVQIILTFEDNLKMLNDYPEIGVYRKQNNIISIIENNSVYIYVDQIFDEHKILFLSYNAIINYK